MADLRVKQRTFAVLGLYHTDISMARWLFLTRRLVFCRWRPCSKATLPCCRDTWTAWHRVTLRTMPGCVGVPAFPTAAMPYGPTQTPIANPRATAVTSSASSVSWSPILLAPVKCEPCLKHPCFDWLQISRVSAHSLIQCSGWELQ